VSGPTFDRTAAQKASWTELPSALHDLWDTCMQNQGGTDVARALTLNVLAIADANDDAALRDITEQLQRHMPCRAFLLLLDETADAETAELLATTRCHGPIRDIVLEQVVLRLRSQDLARVPGLLRPLILDDLPSHLFWALPWPGHEQAFDTLARLCQHVIVDSARFGNPARELPIVKQRQTQQREAEQRQTQQRQTQQRQTPQRQTQGQRVTDLSWLRVQPWRRALAEAFERLDWQPNTPVTGVIRHGKKARATSMLLAGWLHERLAATISMEPEGDHDSIGPDHVSLQVALASGNIEIVIDLNGDKLVTHVTTQSHCYLPFRSAALRGNDAKLISLAIDAS
jgi:glucose-6-phosphate dehydrogenase assembly protein OpcA